MQEPPCENLSDQRKSVCRDLKAWPGHGFSFSTLSPSLLDLDWSLFAACGFQEYADDICDGNPPEFVSYAFSALDAYAAAILAARLPSALGVLNFTCKLKQQSPSLLSPSSMKLAFATIPERGRISPDSVMVELLGSFPEMLQARGFEESSVMFMDGEGCLMEIAYPSHMVGSVSVFLRERHVATWPQVMLSLKPTDELRIRARHILAFLRSTPSVDGIPN